MDTGETGYAGVVVVVQLARSVLLCTALRRWFPHDTPLHSDMGHGEMIIELGGRMRRRALSLAGQCINQELQKRWSY